MKIDEIINEGIMSSFKDMLSGQGRRQTLIQNIFTKDFVQDALVSLRNGITGGFIDPTIRGIQNNSSPTTASNSMATSGPATSSSSDRVSASSQPPYIGKIAPNARRASPPVPTPSPFSSPTIARKTLGVTPNMRAAPGNITTGGSLNEAQGQVGIADYLMRWFGQYMQGVQWQSAIQNVERQLSILEKEYPKNVKQNLGKLAKLAFSLSKAGSPAGAPPSIRQYMEPSPPTHGNQSRTASRSPTASELAKAYKQLPQHERVKFDSSITGGPRQF